MKNTTKIAVISLVLAIISWMLSFLGINTRYLPEIFLGITETISIIGLIMIFRQITKELKVHSDEMFIDKWNTAITQTFGKNKAFKFAANESLIFFYFIYGMFKKPKRDKNDFSYTESGTFKYFIVIIVGVSFAEIPVLHIILRLWNENVAWIVTFLSIYSLIWIIGDFQLMRFHPIRIEDDRICIRIGIRWRIDINYQDIETIQLGKPDKKEYLKITPETKTSIGIKLKIAKPITGLFGITKQTDKLALHVDDNQWFIDRVQSMIFSNLDRSKNIQLEIN